MVMLAATSAANHAEDAFPRPRLHSFPRKRDERPFPSNSAPAALASARCWRAEALFDLISWCSGCCGRPLAKPPAWALRTDRDHSASCRPFHATTAEAQRPAGAGVLSQSIDIAELFAAAASFWGVREISLIGRRSKRRIGGRGGA